MDQRLCGAYGLTVMYTRIVVEQSGCLRLIPRERFKVGTVLGYTRVLSTVSHIGPVRHP